jgi:hypothetical protein
MNSTGYIINGKYIRTKDVPSGATAPRRQPGAKEFEAEADRMRFAKDLVQPYLPNGKPNPEFITALPEEAERYGFVDKNNSNARRHKR